MSAKRQDGSRGFELELKRRAKAIAQRHAEKAVVRAAERYDADRGTTDGLEAGDALQRAVDRLRAARKGRR